MAFLQASLQPLIHTSWRGGRQCSAELDRRAPGTQGERSASYRRFPTVQHRKAAVGGERGTPETPCGRASKSCARRSSLRLSFCVMTSDSVVPSAEVASKSLWVRGMGGTRGGRSGVSAAARWPPAGLPEPTGMLRDCCWGAARSDQRQSEHLPLPRPPPATTSSRASSPVQP